VHDFFSRLLEAARIDPPLVFHGEEFAMLHPGFWYDTPMKIAIFGSDPRAEAIGRLLVDAGYHVCFGDAEGMKPAEAAAERAGAVRAPGSI
jgi:hypothetical protein